MSASADSNCKFCLDPIFLLHCGMATAFLLGHIQWSGVQNDCNNDWQGSVKAQALESRVSTHEARALEQEHPSIEASVCASDYYLVAKGSEAHLNDEESSSLKCRTVMREAPRA